MVYIVLSMSKGTGYGYRTGLRVQGMVYIVLSMSKGAGHGLNGRTLTQQKINSMDQIE
jgi:hypothetical protein